MLAPRAEEGPTYDEVRAALERVVASDMLRHSPQLAAFLRFIVEATLRGEGSQIKGYTIGSEALGRGASFDPQIDPIVRVEAGRLRRALQGYYAGAGAADEIVIELPRGRYVPSFRRRVENPVPAIFSRPGIKARSFAAVPLAWCLSLAALAFLVIGTTTLVATGRWDRLISATALGPTDQQLVSAFRPGDGFPVVSVQSSEAFGTPAVSRITLDRLQAKLTDALARFDQITVIPAAVSSADYKPVVGGLSPNYRLSLTAEYRDDGALPLSFRLIDTNDNTVVWLRSFDRTQFSADPDADEDGIIQQVVPTLAQSFG